jgi:glycosyltransferase involved in cell wall biosynthesis
MAADGHGKSYPNSVIEGLACGCPTVVSASCGIAALIEREWAGIAAPREPAAVASALRVLLDRHEAASTRARALAVRYFDLRTFLATYDRLYEKVRQPSEKLDRPPVDCLR